MSVVTASTSKGEKSKKFQSLDINNIYQVRYFSNAFLTQIISCVWEFHYLTGPITASYLYVYRVQPQSPNKKLFLKNMDYKALVNFLPLGVHLQICLVWKLKIMEMILQLQLFQLDRLGGQEKMINLQQKKQTHLLLMDNLNWSKGIQTIKVKIWQIIFIIWTTVHNRYGSNLLFT